MHNVGLFPVSLLHLVLLCTVFCFRLRLASFLRVGGSPSQKAPREHSPSFHNMPTLYMTEPARSGRGKCKKSKEPIAKGEVRMGKGYEKDDHVMWGWYKPAFFPLPKKELRSTGATSRRGSYRWQRLVACSCCSASICC